MTEPDLTKQDVTEPGATGRDATEPDVSEEAAPAAAGRGGGLAGAAVLIGVITVFARVVGFSRSLVLSHTVGNNCLSTAYFTGNQVTNILFEVVAGGALASLVVPVLAGPAARGAPEARRIASALMTWTVLILVPLSLIAALAAHPVISLLVGDHVPGCSRDQVVDTGTRMLVVFAPQILFYGLAVVMYGVLQAYRRFLGPALAPLVSSVIVIGAYLMFLSTGAAYRQVAPADQWDLSAVTRSAELTLSVGTTLGVVALVATVIFPTARLRLRLRPALTFPPGVAGRIRRLALAGLATLVAQQAAWGIVIALANRRGGGGALPIYQYAWSLFQLPYAVLAVPLATSAFPLLSARASEGDDETFDRTAAGTTRAIVLLSCAGAAVLAATALPVARVFLLHTGGKVPPIDLARAIVAFAPGLIGYGLMAHVGRTLFAAGKGRHSAAAQVTGWIAVIAAEVALVSAAGRHDAVAALGLGNSIGMTVAGVLLLVMLARVRGRGALQGVVRAVVTGLAGAAAGYAAGAGVVAAFGSTGTVGSLAVGVLAALAAAAAFAAVAFLGDPGDLRGLMRRRL
ncbi:murein biosynthesis integral membrane protein MurJ [Actinoallomurus rhizosphaericola]|uniref:murein biosynthesis integral membrane protein MurJ n=1 Tax=Actinoallomurus rhizosphaericola TaxID=2952536 RepID=UPI002092D7B8|nr:lipid II flippase MurJ [Actinoallomurus rhizosphaericola]MCO5999401.1 virulence factor MviN [Actinoallomurus rhizosphaericola]